jgi:hypothetical protein
LDLIDSRAGTTHHSITIIEVANIYTVIQAILFVISEAHLRDIGEEGLSFFGNFCLVAVV